MTKAVSNNHYDKVIKRRSECCLYKLTGGTGRQTGRQAGGQTAPGIERLCL